MSTGFHTFLPGKNLLMREIRIWEGIGENTGMKSRILQKAAGDNHSHHFNSMFSHGYGAIHHINGDISKTSYNFESK